jgi:hypothetical protein
MSVEGVIATAEFIVVSFLPCSSGGHVHPAMIIVVRRLADFIFSIGEADTYSRLLGGRSNDRVSTDGVFSCTGGRIDVGNGSVDDCGEPEC